MNGYEELLDAVPDQLASPEQFAENRKLYARDHVGRTDGRASERIVGYLEKTAVND